MLPWTPLPPLLGRRQHTCACCPWKPLCSQFGMKSVVLDDSDLYGVASVHSKEARVTVQ
jgi:hypothetical protein